MTTTQPANDIMNWHQGNRGQHHSVPVGRHNPYNVVGTSVAGTTDAHEALIAGGLDWTVTLDPITSTHLGDDGVTTVPAPRHFATNWVSDDGGIGNIDVVGNKFHPVQNRDTAAALQAIVDQTGGEFWSVGHTHNRGRTFVQLGLPNNVSFIGGRDEVHWSILALNNHDGHGKFRIVPTPSRVACENQLSALRRSEIEFSISHTKGAATEIDLGYVRAKLNLVVKQIEGFQTLGDALIAQSFGNGEFDRFIEKLFPARVGKDGHETDGSAERAGRLRYLFKTAITQEEIRGTRWGAYNAVTEYVQWERTSLSAERRALATVTGAADLIGQRALALLTS
jgi:phage/plasmid-like protein (TIGR03299 family)